jgi:hypothetical protein
MLSIDLGFKVPFGFAVARPIFSDESKQVLPRIAAVLYAVRIVEGVAVWRV